MFAALPFSAQTGSSAGFSHQSSEWSGLFTPYFARRGWLEILRILFYVLSCVKAFHHEH
jgi:hypothetical protein